MGWDVLKYSRGRASIKYGSMKHIYMCLSIGLLYISYHGVVIKKKTLKATGLRIICTLTLIKNLTKPDRIMIKFLQDQCIPVVIVVFPKILFHLLCEKSCLSACALS